MINHRLLSADVLVAGGGMAGVCAAIAAARHGAKVIIVQDRPVLGGNASSEVRMHIQGADFAGNQPGRRETGLIEAIRLEDAVHNPQRSASMFDLLLWDLVTAESNIRLMLNTTVDGVIMTERDKVAAITASRPSTEERFTIESTMFIDCTGDGRLGMEAGADYRLGREGRAEYNEPSAPDQPDDKALGSSILFITRDHGRPMPFKTPAWARHFTEEDLAQRPHVPFEFGFWWIEWGGDLDTIKDSEMIRDELYRIALGVWDHIKNGSDHGAENWALEWIGALPGKRESRRFLGDHVLTQNELEQATLFPDRVAYGGWPMDTHPPAGIDSPEPPCLQPELEQPYSIPLRSLYSRNIRNLFFAGRNHSATHMAFSSTRVMATCSVMGQAAGTAAALCALRNWTPRELAHNYVAELQQRLLKDDCTILQLKNQDLQDLARQARVTASSAAADAPPENVINGWFRSTETERNLWASASNEPLPQWIRLDLPEPLPLNEVRLTFDTNLFRPLTLTHHDYHTSMMIRAPQPEAVRDYRIELLHEGHWRCVSEIRDNYQRHCIHTFAPQVAQAVRIMVEKTNGIEEARIFEVRIYNTAAS